MSENTLLKSCQTFEYDLLYLFYFPLVYTIFLKHDEVKLFFKEYLKYGELALHKNCKNRSLCFKLITNSNNQTDIWCQTKYLTHTVNCWPTLARFTKTYYLKADRNKLTVQAITILIAMTATK